MKKKWVLEASHFHQKQQDYESIPETIAFRFAMHEAHARDTFIKNIMPKWWVWCVKKGGVLSKIARFFIRVVVVVDKNG